MRIVFFGTPDYVLPILDVLKGAGYDITAVVTQPPKPVGRKGVLTPSPVALWAKTHGIAIFDGKPKEIVEKLKSLGTKVGILGAYGRILPPELLTIFPHGILNIHPSLLPKYRGASPVQAAIATGERQTGATIIRLDEEMDHGPIVAQFTEEIRDDDTAGTLRERLFEKASGALVTVLPTYFEGSAELREQDHAKATYTTLLKKEHGFIPPKYIQIAVQGDPPSSPSLRVEDLRVEDLHKEWQIPFLKDYSLTCPERSRGVPDPYFLERFIRALDPWPGAWTKVKVTGDTAQVTLRLKLLKVHIEEDQRAQEPKSLIARLVPDIVQLEGKNPVSWEEFKKGYPEAKLQD